MRNFYHALACTERSFIKSLKVSLFGLIAIIAAISATTAVSNAQTNPNPGKERQLELERAAFGSSGNNTDPVALEILRESRKSQLSEMQRLAANPRTSANRTITTEATQLINGTLSLAEPVFNRPLTFAQGGSCVLSGVGTATHYRTHTFTLPSASNVVISLDPADGASIAPGSADTFLELINGGVFNPASPCTNAIAADDDGGAGFLSRIATTTPLPAGTYTIVVTSFDNTPTDFPWTYTVVVQTPGCGENFDGVVAPALPAGWTTSATGIGIPWTTSTTSPVSAPNNAFGPETANVGLTELTSPSFPIVSTTAQLVFSNRFNLESGFDGMVLEMSVDGGAFQDILAAGGTFAAGGYNGTLSTGFANPLPGRAAWTGLSGGTTAAPTYITTTVNLPASASGHNVRFRWRVGSDNSAIAAGANGVRIDNISVNGSDCVSPQCAGAPVAGTITGPASGCGGSSVTLTLAGQSSGPGISIQWRSSATPGGPYTNITGAFGTSYTFNATTTTYFVAVITCNNGGASATTPEKALPVGTPVHTAVSSTVTTTCTPGAATITGTVSGGNLTGGAILGNSGAINLAIPDNTPAGVNSTVVVPAFTLANASDLKIRINASHTWVGDLRFTLTSPCGTTFLFDRPGVPPGTFGNSNNLGTSNVSPNPPPAVYTFDLAAATVIPEATLGSGFIPAGSYRPSDAAGAPHTWAGFTFPCTAAGNWVLNISDNAGGDLGRLVDWQIIGPPVYLHTLTGPGTIVQNAPTGAGNSTGNFTVTNLPAGLHTFTLTSTDALGCSAVSQVTALIKQTPIITIAPPAPVICNGTIQQLTASVVPPINQTFSQPATTVVPAGAPTTTAGIAAPYPSTVVVSGLPTSGVTVKSVSLNNVNHTFPDDMDIVLVSPTGTAVVLMSDAGGGTDVVGLNYTLDDAAATTLADNALNPQGTYRPTNFGATDNYPAPGPGSLTQASPTLSSFTGNMNGTWRLYIVDAFTGDVGFVGNWNIVFNIPPTVVFSPTTNLFTDAAATIPYTGTPINTVYARPTTTTTYTVTSTVDGCPGTANVTVTVNQLPAITTQPSPATQTVCPGTNITYSVTATGTGPLTYQWRRNGVNLVNDAQTFGVTTPTLTLFNVNAANSGSYTCVVTGICPPAATSNAAVLNVATAPVIGTQPANATVCVGGATTFSVVSTGTPTPTIFQWQVSTDGGATFSNLANTASSASPSYNNVFSATLNIGNIPASLNTNRYRVIVTNSCGQSTTTNSATLTVNALTPVTIAALPSRICLSDTLVALSAAPTGGSWSGIGVSGFNFIPTSTSVGTYTLTYSYTNPAGCLSTATTSARVEDCPERIRLLRDDGVILFPNPNNGRFNIRINSTLYNYLGMRVYSNAGHLVRSQDFRGLVYGRVVPIDISNLPGGNYMVKFYYDDGVRTSEKTFQVVIAR